MQLFPCFVFEDNLRIIFYYQIKLQLFECT